MQCNHSLNSHIQFWNIEVVVVLVVMVVVPVNRAVYFIRKVHTDNNK